MIRNCPAQYVGAQINGYTGTPNTTGTVTVYLVGDNGSQASIGSATHKGNGYWSIALSAANTNYNHCAFTFVSSNSSVLEVTVQVEPLGGPVVLQTTIATRASATSFTLTAGATIDDAYNGFLIVIGDVTSSSEYSRVQSIVSDYTGATKTITLPVDHGIFTTAVGDTVTIMANPLGVLRAEPAGVPAATITDAEKIDWLFMALRNRIDITSTKKTFYDDGGLAEWEKDLSDDGTTYSESEGNAI